MERKQAISSNQCGLLRFPLPLCYASKSLAFAAAATRSHSHLRFLPDDLFALFTLSYCSIGLDSSFSPNGLTLANIHISCRAASRRCSKPEKGVITKRFHLLVMGVSSFFGNHFLCTSTSHASRKTRAENATNSVARIGFSWCFQHCQQIHQFVLGRRHLRSKRALRTKPR